jgi:hypothetical protein
MLESALSFCSVLVQGFFGRPGLPSEVLGVAAGKDRAAMPPKSDTKTPLLKDMQRQADEVVDLTRQNMEKVKDCILHHSRFFCVCDVDMQRIPRRLLSRDCAAWLVARCAVETMHKTMNSFDWPSSSRGGLLGQQGLCASQTQCIALGTNTFSMHSATDITVARTRTHHAHTQVLERDHHISDLSDKAGESMPCYAVLSHVAIVCLSSR